ncbi:MAG: DUF3579 domain-containing protein [Burkholderiaceae bacterium]
MAKPDASLIDSPRSFMIIGTTVDGKRFRPSDWAERLCGVMSPYRPNLGSGGHISYSPWVMPGQHEGAKCVRVDGSIYALEPLAYRFLLGFASDNNLIVQPTTQDCVKSTDEEMGETVAADRSAADLAS